MSIGRFFSVAFILIYSLFPLSANISGNAVNDQPPCPKFSIQSVPSGIDLDVTYISRSPQYKWDSVKQWPAIGETVTFTAHIINKGTVNTGTFAYQWLVDNQVVAKGSSSSISPQGEVTQSFQWQWKSGRHTIGFQADPQNLISETFETNNSLSDPTDALTLGFWVEQTVYDEFNNLQSGAGTYSWEDWAQRIVQKMNEMFEKSVYPSAPNGIMTRVRIDSISVVPDETLFNQGPWHAPYDTIYDGRWGFSYEEYHNCQCCGASCYDVPWNVIHELGHYLLGRVDVYGLDVQGGDVNVLDESGNRIAGTSLMPYINWDVVHYASRTYDIMHEIDENAFYSDFHVISINRDWPQGQRTHQGWNYIYQIPSETKIRVVDNNDQPLADVQVSIYQALPGDGASGPYSQNFDNTPDIVGTTDAQGLLSLGNKPFGQYELYGITAGIDLLKLKLPNGIYRYTWLETTDLNLAYWRGQTGTYIENIRFPDGPSTMQISSSSVRFVALEGINPLPKDLNVEILGTGIKEMTIQNSTVPWMYTIPANYEYPAGPITVVINSTNLPIGHYSTTFAVTARTGTLNSPQTITVSLDVVKAQHIYLPAIKK